MTKIELGRKSKCRILCESGRWYIEYRLPWWPFWIRVDDWFISYGHANDYCTKQNSHRK